MKGRMTGWLHSAGNGRWVKWKGSNRRANQHQTFHKERNRPIAAQIKVWISELTTTAKVTETRPRRSTDSMVEEWKSKYNDLLAIQCLWETDLHEARAKVDELQSENERRAATIKTLTTELKLLKAKFTVMK